MSTNIIRKLYFPSIFIIILLPTAGRLIFHQFDSTFFIVAGRQFVYSARLPYPVTVTDGPGYDGQFYFKTALDLALPSENGIIYDDPVYRQQRIIYPLAVWFLSFDSAQLIPFALIAVNCLGLILVWLFFYRLCALKSLPLLFSVLPVMYAGLQMGAGRDLVEPLETLFVLGILCFGTSNPLIFSAFATLALLTKETTIVFILPIVVIMIFTFIKQKAKLWYFILVTLPFGLLLAWRLFLERQAHSSLIVRGAFNFTYPFFGIVSGFQTYFNEPSVKNILGIGLPIISSLWLIWLIVLVYPHIKTALGDKLNNRYAEIAWLAWMFFSLFFSSAIYGDPWSFIRLFSAFTSISFFILYNNQHKPGKWFVLVSVFMFAFITVHLWLLA
jgi:hypothetical protein